MTDLFQVENVQGITRITPRTWGKGNSTESQLPEDCTPLTPSEFDGVTYEPELDGSRLRKQLERTRLVCSDGLWRTLQEIADKTGDPLQSVSARLRDLRKPKFGRFTVNRRRRGEASRGLWEYQLLRK